MTFTPVKKPSKHPKGRRAHNSTLPVPSQKTLISGTRSAKKGTSLARKSPVKKVNRKRRASEFARCYHSKERVAFVKSLPCAACGFVGFSQNAHVVDDGTKGGGRKSGYGCIAPLCGPRPAFIFGVTYPGCHHIYDTDPYRLRMRYVTFNEWQAARDTEAAWQEQLRAGSQRAPQDRAVAPKEEGK